MAVRVAVWAVTCTSPSVLIGYLPLSATRRNSLLSGVSSSSSSLLSLVSSPRSSPFSVQSSSSSSSSTHAAAALFYLSLPSPSVCLDTCVSLSFNFLYLGFQTLLPCVLSRRRQKREKKDSEYWAGRLKGDAEDMEDDINRRVSRRLPFRLSSAVSFSFSSFFLSLLCEEPPLLRPSVFSLSRWRKIRRRSPSRKSGPRRLVFQRGACVQKKGKSAVS